jgi:hypothetical protein
MSKGLGRKKARRRAPIEPLTEKTLGGLRLQASRTLRSPADVEEIVQDVHYEYLQGAVRKDLLLRRTSQLAIDRYRYNVVRTRTPLRGDEHDFAEVVDGSTGRVVEATIVAPSASLDPVDPAIDAVAGLMVRGGRIRVASGGRTIANPYRNEDRLIGRLAARQERERGREQDWQAIDRLVRPQRGRPSGKDREAASTALQRARLMPRKPSEDQKKPAPRK